MDHGNHGMDHEMDGDHHHHDKMHPCDKYHQEDPQLAGECHQAVESCYMMHSEEGHEEMMAECVHNGCTAWFAMNPAQAMGLEMSVDDTCWAFVGELHEHYNGKDEHHQKMHPCDEAPDAEYCHNSVNECWMEHSEEGHEEMMASCIHGKCSSYFAENPEAVAMLDGKTVEDTCSEFLNQLHEHYNGKDEHHENMHPCDMHDDHEDQAYCHESVNTCYMEHSEEGHEEMMASCIHQKCSLFFAEKPEKIEMLDGKSVEDACWEFVGALHEYYNEDHHEDDDKHPCDKYHYDNPEHLSFCYDSLDSCHVQYPKDEQMMGNCLYQKCQSFFDEYPEEVDNLEMGVDETCWAFLHELEEYYH